MSTKFRIPVVDKSLQPPISHIDYTNTELLESLGGTDLHKFRVFIWSEYQKENREIRYCNGCQRSFHDGDCCVDENPDSENEADDDDVDEDTDMKDADALAESGYLEELPPAYCVWAVLDEHDRPTAQCCLTNGMPPEIEKYYTDEVKKEEQLASTFGGMKLSDS